MSLQVTRFCDWDDEGRKATASDGPWRSGAVCRKDSWSNQSWWSA